MADGLSLGFSFGHSDGGEATSAMLAAALEEWRALPAATAADMGESLGARAQAGWRGVQAADDW